MKNDLDELLKLVLTPREEAGDILNRRILEQVKETGNMKQKKYKRASAAVIAAAVAAATSLTAFAAWQYRSASDVADSIGDEKLARAFVQQTEAAGETTGGNEEQSPSGESQSCGGYKVTVLGMVSGENLSEYQRKSGDELHSDRTYCAVAIQREDGTAINTEQENFFVSPLIGGLNPDLYNAASLSGNYSEFAEEGILYRLLECDNIAYFADHELYLCVTDTAFYDSSLYNYHEADGSISRNTEYQGLNALFTLKLDTALADPEKAQALIDKVNASSPDEDWEYELPQEMKEAMEWADQITPENIEQYCVRMENTVQTVTVDEDGYFRTQAWLVNEAVSDTRGGSGGKIKFDILFRERIPGLRIDGVSTGDSLEELVITTYTLNEDGTVTFAAWVPKEVSIYLQ